MLSLFRTNQFATNILLVFYVLLLRGAIFFVPIEPASFSHPGILSKVIYQVIGMQGGLADGLAILLVLLQALLINVLMAKFRMARYVSLYPGLFYILLVSSFPDFLHMSPVLMANTFLLLAIYEVFNSYKKYSSADKLFNVGLWIGIAAMFYYSMLVFLLAAIIGFVILRSFKWKEMLMLLCGLLVPYWLVGVWYFFNGQQDVFWQQAIFDNLGSVNWLSISDWISYIQLGTFAFLLLLTLANYNRYTFKVSIRAHKNMDILYWFMAIAAFSLLMQKGVEADHLLILAIPLAIFFSMTMLYIDNRLAEAFHFLIVVGILLLQTKGLWAPMNG